MASLPTNRTQTDADSVHVSDHNELHAGHNLSALHRADAAAHGIADGQVTTAKLGAGVVTAAKVAPDVATQAELDTLAAAALASDGPAGTPSRRTLGTAPTAAMAGNDSRVAGHPHPRITVGLSPPADPAVNDIWIPT